MVQAVDRQRDPLRAEQEELFAPQVRPGFVDCLGERRVVQVERLAAGIDRDPGAGRCQSPELPLQVPADRAGRGEFPFQHGVVHRPGPLYGQPRVPAFFVGLLHGVA